jgi:hypothetical protein
MDAMKWTIIYRETSVFEAEVEADNHIAAREEFERQWDRIGSADSASTDVEGPYITDVYPTRRWMP